MIFVRCFYVLGVVCVLMMHSNYVIKASLSVILEEKCPTFLWRCFDFVGLSFEISTVFDACLLHAIATEFISVLFLIQWRIWKSVLFQYDTHTHTFEGNFNEFISFFFSFDYYFKICMMSYNSCDSSMRTRWSFRLFTHYSHLLLLFSSWKVKGYIEFIQKTKNQSRIKQYNNVPYIQIILVAESKHNNYQDSILQMLLRSKHILY